LNLLLLEQGNGQRPTANGQQPPTFDLQDGGLLLLQAPPELRSLIHSIPWGWTQGAVVMWIAWLKDGDGGCGSAVCGLAEEGVKLPLPASMLLHYAAALRLARILRLMIQLACKPIVRAPPSSSPGSLLYLKAHFLRNAESSLCALREPFHVQHGYIRQWAR
jgi:hypothetical protein